MTTKPKYEFGNESLEISEKERDYNPGISWLKNIPKHNSKSDRGIERLDFYIDSNFQR